MTDIKCNDRVCRYNKDNKCTAKTLDILNGKCVTKALYDGEIITYSAGSGWRMLNGSIAIMDVMKEKDVCRAIFENEHGHYEKVENKETNKFKIEYFLGNYHDTLYVPSDCSEDEIMELIVRCLPDIQIMQRE